MSNPYAQPYTNSLGGLGDVAGNGMSDVVAIREATHGPFTKTATIAQDTKKLWRSAPGWEKLASARQEALEHIASKVARILVGNADEQDHYIDIAGYAELARTNGGATA